MIKTQYIDELQDLYEFHFNYMQKDVLMHLQSAGAVLSLLNTMRNSSFSHPELAQQAVAKYRELADFAISEMSEGRVTA